jgi:hypothetical protein
VSPEALGVGLYQEEGIGSKKGRKHYREVWPLMRLFFLVVGFYAASKFKIIDLQIENLSI